MMTYWTFGMFTSVWRTTLGMVLSYLEAKFIYSYGTKLSDCIFEQEEEEEEKEDVCEGEKEEKKE